ncbi:DUF2971 domain-containing protein [Halarcobacter sp.]|uniref:DUF2971 domain-containing protein n=1 Tax=Halarcobacter sp. TaxID=2321133 RepID=UPI002AAA674A|nr:DUF2971 domain-containing protein [Halarcobacter sp.]
MRLYKYMSTKKYIKDGKERNPLKYIFEDKTLRFSSPIEFNDPFEFKYSIKNLNPSESSELNEIVNCLNTNDKLHYATLDYSLKSIGTLCLSGEKDNILMWSHYSDNHRGIVLELDAEHDFFKNKLNNYELKILPYGLKKVNYVEDRLIFEDLSAFMDEKFYLTKNIIWKYEDEYRMTILLDEVDDSNKYNIKFPTNLIKAVYLGINIDNKDIEYIKEIKNNEEWKHIKVYQFKPDNKEYKLHPYEILL